MGTGISHQTVAPTMTDPDLVQACRAGDERAWGLLVDRFARYVYAIAVQAYRLPAHDAEDVFQEVFTRTFEHLDRLRSDAAIRPWIGQLTRRLAIDRLRAAGRESLGEQSLELVEGQADRELEQIELAIGLRDALQTLPDNCREILDRFFARGQSYHEIADALGVPMGTVASRISRCLTRLRAELGEASR
ncbi:MAG TPA: sigma-70 family RNA polymerase sigma factor [Solirubrobacteraceae bacterium]|nr:sigma-70 family RNA polymerase sigma factor [Solirubrobacteraceae bacterium]